MDKFLSCDWGTSFFRLRLVETETLKVIAEEKNDKGIASTFKSWRENGAEEETRQTFYQSVITEAIQTLSKQLNLNLNGIPVIISGMAASSIGMLDLPYKAIPISIDGSGLEIKKLTIHESENEFIIISGIRCDNDVIRGEETKITGCAPYLNDGQEQLLIFTGTHPKHVTIRDKQVVDIKTYMTGEFFDLLVNHSVLAASVNKGDDFYKAENQISFKQGVEASTNSNLLHAAFSVRTNDVLKHIPKENNYYYLSGLLIGTELKDISNSKSPVYLCGGNDLIHYYQLACDVLNIKVSSIIDADEALLKGHRAIYSMYI
jgi:2-dehydro-3-deoxygalactonokinase